jgi:hypothetical protein
MSNPFRYFNSSPEVIRLVVMMYVKHPLSLRNIEDLLAGRCHANLNLRREVRKSRRFEPLHLAFPSSRMLLQAAQDRRVADRHAEPSHQPLRGPPARAMAKQPNDSRQAGGLARERRRKTRQALGEDAPITPLVPTPPARQAGINDDRCSLSGQIPKRSRVSAVTRFGLRTASRTGGRLPAVHRDRPSLFSPLNAHDVQAWRGWVTMELMFSSPLLRYTGARCQPARASSGRIAPGACTKSKSDPLKMYADSDAAAPSAMKADELRVLNRSAGVQGCRSFHLSSPARSLEAQSIDISIPRSQLGMAAPRAARRLL